MEELIEIVSADSHLTQGLKNDDPPTLLTNPSWSRFSGHLDWVTKNQHPGQSRISVNSNASKGRTSQCLGGELVGRPFFDA
jgi:hypothetical protein